MHGCCCCCCIARALVLSPSPLSLRQIFVGSRELPHALEELGGAGLLLRGGAVGERRPHLSCNGGGVVLAWLAVLRRSFGFVLCGIASGVLFRVSIHRYLSRGWWATCLSEVLCVPVDADEQPAVCEEPQALVQGRGGDGFAHVAVGDLAGGVGDGEAVAGPLAHHFLQAANTIGV